MKIDTLEAIFYTVLTSLLMSIGELTVFYMKISKDISNQIDNSLKKISENEQDLFSKDQERIKQDIEIMKSKLDLDSIKSKKTNSQQKQQKLKKVSAQSQNRKSTSKTPDPHDDDNIFCPISY